MSYNDRADLIKRAARAAKLDEDVLADIFSHPQRGRDATGNELVIIMRHVASAAGETKKYAPFVVTKDGAETTETPLTEYAKARKDWAHFLPVLMAGAGVDESAVSTGTDLLDGYLKKEIERQKQAATKPLF